MNLIREEAPILATLHNKGGNLATRLFRDAHAFEAFHFERLEAAFAFVAHNLQRGKRLVEGAGLGAVVLRASVGNGEEGEDLFVGGECVVLHNPSIMPQSRGNATPKTLFLFFFLAWESVPGFRKRFFIFPIDKGSA